MVDTRINPDNQSAESNHTDITTFLQARRLKLFHLNINGLAKKIDDVKVLLLERKNYIDILELPRYIYEKRSVMEGSGLKVIHL